MAGSKQHPGAANGVKHDQEETPMPYGKVALIGGRLNCAKTRGMTRTRSLRSDHVREHVFVHDADASRSLHD